jgi:hypothetical protein
MMLKCAPSLVLLLRRLSRTMLDSVVKLYAVISIWTTTEYRM